MESGITMTDHSDWSGVFSPRCFSLLLKEYYGTVGDLSVAKSKNDEDNIINS